MDTMHTPDVRDQHIADVRAALQRAIPFLGFSAGREAATDPNYSGRLFAAADDLTNTLDRTAP
ncbi:hypothetical protein [Kitasatospora sp. NPDC059327]|uniref:hypothetical protein n=1 Tax=Kitasatospora sp. NPDC059327 TaxID=3346803 RepID=UPI003690FE54